MMSLSLCSSVLATLAPTFPSFQDLPPRISDLYRPDEDRVWVFERAGERIGHHVFRYEGSVDVLGRRAHRFTSRVHLAARSGRGWPEQRHVGELLTDDDGRALRSVLESWLGDTYSRVELSIASGRASVIHQGGRSPEEFSVDVAEGAFLQANYFIGYLEIVHGLAQRAEGGVIRAKLLSQDTLQTVDYRARPAEGKLMDSLGATITRSEDGRIREVEFPAQQLRMMLSDERPEPFVVDRPKPAVQSEDFDVDPVVIGRGAVTIVAEPSRAPEVYDETVLKGEVTRLKVAKGPLPAVLFLSGSGLQDRDGYSSGIDLGTREILDHLTRQGFLVLRMDDRGAGESTGPIEDMPFEEVVADARACLDHLLGREDVDPERVALIGHSEGGIVAPILAVERPRLAAVVLMAAPSRPISELIRDQNRRALDEMGLSGEAREKYLNEVKRSLGLSASAEKIDPKANVARVKCPVLVLQGGKDIQVSPEKDAQVLAKALDEAKHADHELVVFPELDHLFKKVRGEESTAAEFYTRRSIDVDFLDALSNWLSTRLKPR